MQVTLVARDQLDVSHAARAAARAMAVDPRPEVGHRAIREAVTDDGALDPSRLRAEIDISARWVTVTVRYAAPTDVPLVGRLVGDVEVEARARFRREA